jgi:hypothetical protein
LIAEGHAPPRIGMFYDTTALQQQNGGTPPDLTTTSGKAFFDRVPANLWATIGGRPIIVLYGA